MSSVDLKNLSIRELQKLVKKEHNENKKLKKDKKKEKLIQVYQKLQKQNEKLRQEKPKIKSKPKLKTETKPKPKTKSFDDYFRECIKNQSIPKDTPPYLKKALERALKEYNVGIKNEKSALDNFAEKYVIDGKPKIIPLEYFKEKAPKIKDFLRNHRNIKIRMLMTCLMEQQVILNKKKLFINKTMLILIQKHI